MKERKIRFGYKVFRELNGMYSLYQETTEGGLPFKEGQKSTPRAGCGPITLLKTRKAAKFLFEHTVVLKCVCFKVVYKLSPLNTVWNGRHHREVSSLEETNKQILIPGQTVLAEWVIPVEEVKFKVGR